MTHSGFLRYVRLILLLLIVSLITVMLVRGITRRAMVRESTTTAPPGSLTLAETTQLDTNGIPLSAYAAVDPAIIPALEAIGDFGASDPQAASAAGIPPLGAYLPAAGESQFTLPKPTLVPSLIPSATITPIPPTPTFAPPLTFTPGTAEIVMTPAPTHIGPDGSPGSSPTVYGGDNCAPSEWPVAGLLTQYFKWYHQGIDLGAPLGTPVYATHSARVVFAGWRTDGYGNLVILQNGMFITYYAHLTEFNVVEGQIIGRGSLIGWTGSTGNSTGPHVHYEIRINDTPVDPLTFEARGYPSC